MCAYLNYNLYVSPSFLIFCILHPVTRSRCVCDKADFKFRAHLDSSQTRIDDRITHRRQLRNPGIVGLIAGAVIMILLAFGLTSFGGPIAHLGYFRDEFVARRKWIDDAGYADLVALCQFLPGPASSQVGFALGMLRGGPLGAAAAWAARVRTEVRERDATSRLAIDGRDASSPASATGVDVTFAMNRSRISSTSANWLTVRTR